MHGRYLAVSTSLLYRDPEFTPQSVIVFSVLRGMTVRRLSSFMILAFHTDDIISQQFGGTVATFVDDDPDAGT